MSCSVVSSSGNCLALSMTRAKTGVFFLSVYQQDGVTPQSLAGCVLWFHAAITATAFLVIDKYSDTGGIVITNPAGGADCAVLTIDPADTEGLPEFGVYSMPCELTLVLGAARYELASGSLTVGSNVGTP